MKHVSVAAALVLFVSFFCAAQTQTGDASYNRTKTGLSISHPSLSFNTRVRVTNLENNRSVEAIVNGRIPITPDRIADISRDAGNALGMARNGMTQVQIEILPFSQAVSAPLPAGENQGLPPAAPEPVEAPPPEPPPAPPPPAPAQPASAPSAPASPVPAAPPPAPAPVAARTEVQYVPVSYPVQSCCPTPLIAALLILLCLAVLTLIVLLVLFWRRFPFWPCRYPVWIRRHLLCAKKRRR
jgi:hypothetical protein